MKLIAIPRINALGFIGPEKTPKYLGLNYFDIIKTKNENISEDQRLIEKKTKELMNEKCLFVGGDHSITYPLVKNFNEIYGETSFLIVFDAHPDCMPSMVEPTHEEFVYGIIKAGFNPKNILLLGIRKIEPEERELLKKEKIKYFSAGENLEIVKEYILKNTLNKKVYLSIDIDALNPKVCPAVNYPEPKGYSEEIFFNLLNFIKEKCNVKARDLVEIVPEKDEKGKTKEFAIRIIKKLTTN